MCEKEEINLVWLKRDLRTQDHLPLSLAEKANKPYLIFYIYEPSLIEHKDSSLRHQQFVYHSIKSMNNKLAKEGQQAKLFYGEAESIFKRILNTFSVKTVFSYQESGIVKSWNRDRAIKILLAEQKVDWHECQRDGILRGIKNRDGWDKKWCLTMATATIKNVFKQNRPKEDIDEFRLPKELKKTLEDYPDPFQKAGEDFAWKYLISFAEDRGRNYHKHISKPELSRKSCGRISPYLAWGNISIKQAVQFLKNHTERANHKMAFKGILTRLKWHCHFIQKFETDCRYETDCINKGFEAMQKTNDNDLLLAWKKGMTGYPLIDACMRCVTKTGWINFRMRAMLVSFLCHHLDLDWRRGIYHLANQFLDYEPGIHYPQFQMQAGTTGVNTVRMYNPVKQSMDHDPKAVFIKKWIPELNSVPKELIHMPWKLTDMEQQLFGINIGKDYPKPIIDHEHAARVAKEKIYFFKNSKAVRDEKPKILERLTRRSKQKRI